MSGSYIVIMNLFKSKALDISNLISMREKYYTHEFYREIFLKKEKIADYIDDSENFAVTIIHAFNNNIQNPKYDIEVMYKMNGSAVPEGVQKVDRLYLKDSVCVELIDEPEKMQKGVQALNDLALKMRLAIGRNVWVQHYRDKHLYIYLYAEKRDD